MNYVFGTPDDDVSAFIVGTAMIYNHWKGNDFEIEIHRDEENMTTISDVLMSPYSNFTTFSSFVKSDIKVKAGYEIFDSYGGDDWFKERDVEQMDIQLNKSLYYSKEKLKKVAHCLTDVFIEHSEIPNSGLGLFANRNFAKGEIVDVSPVLLTRKIDIELISNESALMNYCITSPELTVVIIPIGYGAAINHRHEKYCNLQMEWFEWRTSKPKSRKDASLNDLLKSKFSPLDISYRAKRNIKKGEELTINYGTEWVIEWESYLASRETSKKLFRLPIIADRDFFPQHWFEGRRHDEL